MVRPRRDSGIVPAKQRLEDAFWAMLAEMPFANFTIEAICKRAQVSHNSLYYYYSNLDQMASVLLEDNLVPELPRMVLNGFVDGRLYADLLLGDPLLVMRFRRVCLLVGNNAAPWMREQLTRSITALWLASIDTDPAHPDPRLGAHLAFILGGVMAILGDPDLGDPAQLITWIAHDFGPAIRSVLNSPQP